MLVNPPKVSLKNDAVENKEVKIYYANLDGCTYICKNGHICRFEGGQYVTDKPDEIEELEAVCDIESQHMYSRTPLAVLANDSKLLKEVSGRVIQGPVGSAALAGMVKV